MRRRLVLFLSLLALSACQKAGERADLLDTRTPPQVGPRFYPPEGWAWGEVDKVRYGVTAPAAAPRGHIVILAGSDEPAEVYFETVRDLTARGWTVWVMDAAADPVSGAMALRTLVDNVIRPKADAPLVVAATGTGSVEALLAVEQNPRRIDGLFLWTPRLSEPLADEARGRVKSGFGGLTPSTEKDWARPDYDLSSRATLAEAWRTANPDLRPRKRPWSWFDGQARGLATALGAARLTTVRVPTLLLGQGPGLDALCKGLGQCSLKPLGDGVPAHLSTDERRGPWLEELAGFADSVAGHSL